MNPFRKISLISSIILIVVISAQIVFLQHIRSKRKIIENDIHLQEEKIARTVSSKTKNAQPPLKNEPRSNVFIIATHLARMHQLSVLDLQMGASESSLKITLKGALENFISFLGEFSKKLPDFRFTHINISTNRQLQFELQCAKFTREDK